MIDVEADVFDFVARRVLAKHDGVYITGEDVKAPPSFPCVSIVESSNIDYTGSRDTSSNANHAVVMYQVNIYSNKTANKKSECKAIAGTVDDAFHELGFTRSMLQPVENMADSTIYRMLGRYTAVASVDSRIFRR